MSPWPFMAADAKEALDVQKDAAINALDSREPICVCAECGRMGYHEEECAKKDEQGEDQCPATR